LSFHSHFEGFFLYRQTVVFLIFFFVALGIRLYQLGSEGFDLDELASVYFSQSPFSVMIQDTNPSGYSLFLKVYGSMFSLDEMVMRLPGVLFSSLACGVLGVFGFGLSSFWGVMPGVIMAFHPLSVDLARTVRPYGLLVLIFVLFFLFWSKGRRRLAFFLSVTAFCFHWMGGFLALGLVLEWIWRRDHLSNWKRALLCAVFVGAFLVAAGLMISQLSFHLDWQALRYQATPFFQDLGKTISQLMGLNSIWMGFIFFSFVLWRSVFKEKSKGFVLFALLPMGILLLLQVTFEKSFFLPRYLFLTGPVLMIFLVRSFALQVPGRWLGALMLCVFVALELQSLPEIYTQKEPSWKDALTLAAQGQRGPIFTTRSLAIRVYGDPLGLEIFPFKGLESEIEMIFGNVNSYGSTWMIDNYLGSLTYWGSLKAEATIKGYKIHEYYFKGHPEFNGIRLMELKRDR